MASADGGQGSMLKSFKNFKKKVRPDSSTPLFKTRGVKMD